MNTKGQLIIIEGPDGIGKSTLVEKLGARLKADGRSVFTSSFPGRDPGTLGNLVYRLHHDSEEFGIETVSPTSLQIMHIASHVDAIERRIIPRINDGITVILDRFWWSTVVYGITNGVDHEVLEKMVELEKLSWGGYQPDLAVLLTRDAPFCARPEHKYWDTLCSEYNKLTQKETAYYRVELVHAESDPDKLALAVEDLVFQTKVSSKHDESESI